MLNVFKNDNVLGAFLQPECSPYTALRYVQPGPQVLFDLDHVDGTLSPMRTASIQPR